MPETTMSSAFKAAGFMPMPDKLREMMVTAIEAGGGKLEPTFDYFVAALAKAGDPNLLWELFEPVRRQVIGALFMKVRTEYATKVVEAGHTRDSPKGARDGVPASTNAPGPGQPTPSPQGAKRLIPDSGAQGGGAGQMMRSPQGAKVAVPAPPPLPTKISYRGLGEAVAAARLETFMVRDTGRRKRRFGEFRLRDLPALASHHARNAWTTTSDYNLIILTMKWANTQAYLSPDTKIGDVLDEATFEKLVENSVERTTGSLIQMPWEIEKIAAHA